MRNRNGIYIIAIALIAITWQSCAFQQSPVSGSKRAYGYTWDQELRLGRDADQQIIDYYGLYDDPELTAYVTRVGERVLTQSHMRRDDTPPMFRNTEFTFRVLSSPVVNAFALPGGYNYVTRGLLTHVTSEAQLAMVLGHEVAHVAARHASQQALRQQAGNILLVGTAVLGQELLGIPGQQIIGLGGSAAQLLFLSYSRDAERESDRLGVEYAAKAGYDASQGAAFFTTLRRLSARAGANIPNHLSSHPDPGEREKDITARSQRWREQGFAQEVVNQREFYQAIEGMVFGENPREGFTRDGIFFHPELAFQFPVPQGWQIINEPSQVVLVTSDQKAVTIFTLPGTQTTAEAVDQVGNIEGMTVVSREAVTLNGLTAHRLVGTVTQENQALSVFVTAVALNGTIYRFLSYSAQADFPTHQSNFERTAGGFSRVTDSAVLNVQPARIQIVTANRTAVFSSFLPNDLPVGVDAEEIAIINQVQLNETVPEGTLLKIPR